jgi:maltose alpha-D-glucosyltransferase/alpha-amylase
MEAAASWARYWSGWVGAAFIKAYLESSRAAPYLPASETDLHILMEAEFLRNAVYEVGYELNHRPAWVDIPLQAILKLMNPEDKP